MEEVVVEVEEEEVMLATVAWCWRFMAANPGWEP
jgi:hypothetical protein